MVNRGGFATLLAKKFSAREHAEQRQFCWPDSGNLAEHFRKSVWTSNHHGGSQSWSLVVTCSDKAEDQLVSVKSNNGPKMQNAQSHQSFPFQQTFVVLEQHLHNLCGSILNLAIVVPPGGGGHVGG